MPEVRDIIEIVDDFTRALTLTTTPEGGTGWTIADTSAAGSPTYATISSPSGELKLTLAATSEAENVCLYQNDILPLSLSQLQEVEFLAKVAGIDAVTTLVLGVGSARNDTLDSVTNLAWFRMEGSVSTSAVVVETDDGTTDLDDKATGQTLASTYKRLVINFDNGLTDVRFFMEDSNGHLARVAAATTFDMSAAAANNVQPIVQIQKASGTGVPSVTIDRVKIRLKRAS